MKKLYQEIRIENFEEIRKEISLLLPDDISTFKDGMKSWVVDTNQTLTRCPFLNKFYVENIKKPISQIKFYVSPPGHGIRPHIDGDTFNKQPFSLILPIANTKNTFLNWYKEDPDNFETRDLMTNPWPKNFKSVLKQVIVPKDIDKLRILDSLELVEPTFARTNIMHDVTNRTNQTRITVVLRWGLHYTEIEEVFKT
jgi:hypothetical protein